MARQFDDLVMVASGSLSEIQAWSAVLLAEGILYQVVGDNLAAGLGSAFPNSVELWVRRADAEAAESAMADRFHNSSALASTCRRTAVWNRARDGITQSARRPMWSAASSRRCSERR